MQNRSFTFTFAKRQIQSNVVHRTQEVSNTNNFGAVSNAFDTIDHTIILNKLKYYGLKGPTLNLFQSYLSNRKQYTEIEDITSTILPIQVGVPQGSILGPILFIIYVNDLPQCTNKFDFIMYADDTTLSSTIDSFSDITSNINADSLINAEICKVIEWLKINKLSLNKTKSKYMTFHMPKKEIQHLTLTASTLRRLKNLIV